MADEGEKKSKSDECIQVVVRCRPLSKKEKDESRAPIISIDYEARQVAIANPDAPAEQPKSFTFDGAFDETTQQKFFYEEACFSLIENVLEGFNGTIFAYGQTGCGKSWTMQGMQNPPELRGVIPNSFSHIFEFIKATANAQFVIRCSYLEIYNEEIKDLLCMSGKGNQVMKEEVKCEIKEDPTKGIYVKGLSLHVVESADDLLNQLETGLSYRTVAATKMNAESSRSHSIFTIVVEMSYKDDSGRELLRAGKLNLVDLAGSERQKKTGASGDLLKEGAKINLSLSALGNVISSLAEGKVKHIPYRDSKLTRLLQDSLGGNTKTLMVAAISPADYNYDETLSTLRYANRAKNIKNKPKINEDPKDTMIREFREEIEKLKKMLAEQSNQLASGGSNQTSANPLPTFDFAALVGGGAPAPSTVSESKSHDGPVKERVVEKIVEKVVHVEGGVDAEKHAKLLREREAEIEKERQLREELTLRMEQLQHMIVGHEASAKPVEETAQERAERLEAAKVHKERKMKARKKREQRQQAEMQRVLEERQAMEDELEELRLAQDQMNVENVEKKMTKLKKKYEKKMQNLRNELDEAREEFSAERQMLIETIEDLEKNNKLYQQICEGLMSKSDLQRLCDNCRYSEQDNEWILPYMKRKSYDITSQPSSANNSFLPGIGGGGSNMYRMPSDRGLTHQNSSNMMNTAMFSGTMNLSSVESLGSSRLKKNEIDFYSDDPKAPSPRAPVPSINLPSSINSKGTMSGPSSTNNSGRVPLLQLGSVSNQYEEKTSSTTAPEGIAAKKKKKKKVKKEIKASYDAPPQDNNALPDEAGAGEYAGPLAEWGFAEDGILGKQPQEDDGDDEYGDDEFEDDENNASAQNKNSINPPQYSSMPSPTISGGKGNNSKSIQQQRKIVPGLGAPNQISSSIQSDPGMNQSHDSYMSNSGRDAKQVNSSLPSIKKSSPRGLPML